MRDKASSRPRIAIVGGVFDSTLRRSEFMLSAPEYRQERCLAEVAETTRLGLDEPWLKLVRLRADAVVVNHFSKTAVRLAFTHKRLVYVNHNGVSARPWLRPPSRAGRCGLWLVLRRAKVVVSLSDEEFAALRSLSPRSNVVLLANQLDPLHYTYPPSTGERSVDLTFVGHYTHDKGLFVLLDALALAERRSGRSYRVQCVGFATTTQVDEVRYRLERLGIRSAIELTREGLELEALNGLLRKTRVLVLPSFAEAQSTVLEEALAAGCRILASTVGAATTRLPATWLYAPGNAHHLAVLIQSSFEESQIPGGIPVTTVATGFGRWCGVFRNLVLEVAP